MAEYYYNDKLSQHDDFIGMIPCNATVLEFGAATGYITRILSEEKNCQVTCIERSPRMAREASKYAVQTIVADLDTDNWYEPLSNKQFDVLLFADVLEHLRTPQQVVEQACALLQHNGCVITSIPNIAHNAVLLSLQQGKFQYRETGLLDNTHIHLFTRQSIYAMMQQCGLYCAQECNKLIRPCDTELTQYYAQGGLMSLSLLHRPDAHTYRFVQKWDKTEHTAPKAPKLSFAQQCYELLYDICCYLKRKHHLQCPKLRKFIFG